MRVAVTGFALSSPFGTSLERFWRGLLEGPPAGALRSSPSFPELGHVVADLPAEVPGGGRAAAPERVAALAEDLFLRALESAGLSLGALPDGAGLALGSQFAETDYVARPVPAVPPPLLDDLARRMGLYGPVVNTPVACAAGNFALGWALDRLQSGEAPLMVAGGLDVVGDYMIGGFEAFGALAEGPPRPFASDRDGFRLGEGGALFVLEPLESARAAGRRVRAVLVGSGAGHDAFHSARPAPDGRGLKRALRTALREARLRPSQIDYVNAHGPGTFANDVGEAAAYREVFGPRAVPVSSTKAALGHAQGGANGLEAAACLLALEHQCIPPTLLGASAVDPSLELDVVVNAARPAPLQRVLSSASGMGGDCGVVIFERADA